MTYTIRHYYLSSLGTIFLIAFLSYYASYPGLLSSSSGIEPVHRIFPRILPTLFDHVGEPNVDTFCEGLLLTGIILSCLLASGIIHHATIFLLVTSIYTVLVKVGNTFYSFQWDVLLLEAGFLTSVSGYAPWMTRTTTISTTHDDKRIHVVNNSSSLPCSAWPLRFLLFKLMLLSGAVKIQADCPTWINLTALEYHFATQCLPGPLAWYAHQLHPFLLRLSVALTLWIEIPVAFLLLAPNVYWRRIAATLQIVLQVLIIVSGNYNFFNLLTITLTLPCIEKDYSEHSEKQDEEKEHHDGILYLLQNKIRQYRVEGTSCCLLLAWSFHCMFRFGIVNKQWNVQLLISRAMIDSFLKNAVPITVPVSFIFLVISSLYQLKKKPSWSSLPLASIQTIICVLCIGTAAVPFISYGNTESQFIGYKTLFLPLWRGHLQPNHFSNSYGLFRRMTGVGDISKYGYSHRNQGWAGQPPSLVERPEIVLEGIFMKNNRKMDEETREIQFRWKPGAIEKSPKQVAPHQPRLDWQMWFAALGNYQHNPWLINFIDKMLQDCRDVIELVDEPALLSGNENLVKLRAKLYHYDFTRSNTAWNRAIPAVHVEKWSENYWTRKMKYDYLPPIEKNNPSVASFLSSHGYPKTCQMVTKRCKAKKEWNSFCQHTVYIREHNLFWFPIICVIIYWGWCNFKNSIDWNKPLIQESTKEKIN